MRKPGYPLILIILFGLIIGAYHTPIQWKHRYNVRPMTSKKGRGEWHEQRAYPHLTLPQDGFYQAWEQTRNRLSKGGYPQLQTEDTWKSIGPTNQGGRTNALAIDPQNPNIIYTGSASGGLWRLTLVDEAGNDYFWERIDTGYPVLGVGAIAIDPQNSNHMLVGTGEVYGYRFSEGSITFRWTRGSYGIGILRTTDGGVTWTKSLDWTKAMMRGVQAIQFHPTNPDIVLAGTSEGTYRSMNGGFSWTRVHNALMAVDIDFNPVYPDTVYLSCGNFGTQDNGLYRSADGGLSWERISVGLPEFWDGKTLLDVCQSHPHIIYADVANMFEGLGLYRSKDGGDSWFQVSPLDFPEYQGWFSHYIRVHPENPDKIFQAGVTYGLSDDAGRHWHIEDGIYDFIDDATLPHPDHHAFANHPTNPDLFFIGNDGGVHRTTDGGMTFQDFNQGYVTTQFYPGFTSSASDSNFALGGLQDNGTAIYYGQSDWKTWAFWGDGAYTAIDPLNNSTIYASSQVLHFWRSNNQGYDWDSWTPIYPTRDARHDDEAAAFIAPYVLVGTDIIYAATNYVYKSIDGGTTWITLNDGQALNGDIISALAVSQSNPDFVAVATVPDFFDGGNVQVFASTNGGVTWVNITQNLPDRWIIDLVISPHREDELYAALSGFGTSHLYRTRIGISDWEDIGSGLPDIPASAVLIDPEDFSRIYIGNDLGVWATTDDGYSWSPFIDGMPNASLVYDLSYSASNRKIRAVTHGNGVYERSMLPKSSEEVRGIPAAFALRQNVPNPFNAETKINIVISQQEHVIIAIYNLLGQKIRTLADRRLGRGVHQFVWDGKDEDGVPQRSGTYYYQMQAGAHKESRKMVLIR